LDPNELSCKKNRRIPDRERFGRGRPAGHPGYLVPVVLEAMTTWAGPVEKKGRLHL
jgi:hypothetical protein